MKALTSVTLMFVAMLRTAVAADSTSVFKPFADRVQEYMKVRASTQGLFSHSRTTNKHKDIIERQRSLAEALRKARANAKQGDVFTPEIADQFRRVIRDQFAGPNGAEIRKTIRQGEPTGTTHLEINDSYPEQKARTTVPPTLLIALPALPPELAYRIVGRDLVLQDKEARTIVDYIPDAIP